MLSLRRIIAASGSYTYVKPHYGILLHRFVQNSSGLSSQTVFGQNHSTRGLYLNDNSSGRSAISR